MFYLKILLCALAVLSLLDSKLISAEVKKNIRLLITSDLHGWLSDTLVYPSKKSAGLLYLADIIRKAKNNDPDLILIDGGDLLQGSPLVHYYNHFSSRPAQENPFFQLFLSLGYDAVVVGNHDLAINPLLEQEYLPNSNFSWLSANIYRQETLVFKPFKILSKAGLKIAIIGFTTTGALIWTDKKQLKKMKIQAVNKSAAKYLKILKNHIKADLIIGVFHVGLSPFRDDENSKLNRIPPVNNAYDTIEQFSEFDLAIIGHDHRLFPRRSGQPVKFISQTPVVGGGSWGKALIDLKLQLAQNSGKWEIENIETYIRKKKDSKKLRQKYINDLPHKYTKYLLEELPWKVSKVSSQQAGTCFNLLNGMAQNNPKIIGSLLPQVRINNIKSNIGKQIRRVDLFKWFKYDNKSVTVKVSEKDILLLKCPAPRFGSKRIPYNRKLFPWFKIQLETDKKKNWLLDPKQFLKQYFIKISEYHFWGGGGVTAGIFLNRDEPAKISNLYLRDRLFEFLKTNNTNLPPVCGFLRYENSQ